jgi:hypothetical protein
VVGLYLVTVLESLEGRRGRNVLAMVAALAAAYVVALAVAPLRRFFELAPMGPGMATTALLAAAISIAALWLAGFSPGSRGQLPDGTTGVTA